MSKVYYMSSQNLGHLWYLVVGFSMMNTSRSSTLDGVVGSWLQIHPHFVTLGSRQWCTTKLKIGGCNIRMSVVNICKASCATRHVSDFSTPTIRGTVLII